MSMDSRSARRAGVLLHPTSLPGRHGIGDLGAGVDRFVEWLESAGMRAWQILPLVPPGAGDSPYSSWSAFAGNPWLIDLDDLATHGLIDRPPEVPWSDRVDFAAMQAFKAPRLAEAARRLLSGHAWTPAFEAFCARSDWLDDATLFEALRVHHDLAPWWTWPAGIRSRDAKALAAARVAHADAIAQAKAVQFFFDRQWQRVQALTASKGIEIIGDLPIYVDANSADVWCDQDLFELDADGHRERVAGVPPDAFSDTGQLWGNPLYRWDRLAETGYAWWIARLKRALALADRVRVDHFRAFAAYWAVPADAPDARTGAWIPGPGQGFFDAMAAALGPLPLIAEDLGIIDDPVRQLLASSGFPGMHVLQFAFGGGADNAYLPHNHRPNAVAYPGTHDNDTTLGWWLKAPAHVQDHVRRYFGVGGHDLVWDFNRAALASVAEVAILAMQDVLALDSSGRMNTPAVAGGNWGWRVHVHGLRDDHAQRLRGLCRLFGR